MSSPSSPPLIVDVTNRPVERRLAYGTAMAAAGLPFGALVFETHSILILAGLLSALVLLGLRTCGWFGGPRRIVQLAWLTDGRWIARRANGDCAECDLCLNSRVGRQALWLRLRPVDPPAQVFSVLLSRAHESNDQLRRLIVRLRLDVPRSGAAAGLG